MTTNRCLALLALPVAFACSCSADVGSDADPMEAIERSSAALSVPSGAAYLPFSSSAAAPGTVALTFDDGPDDTNTERVLDVLAEKGVTATFFVNTENWCALPHDSHCRAVLARIYAEGHTVGNHTAHHYDLSLTSTNVDGELSQVVREVHAAVPSAPAITYTRAPYGNPYESGPQSRLNVVAPIVARYGVHIGWSIDSADSTSCTTASCVKSHVASALNAGRYGVILMHATYSWSAKALPAIIDDIRARGMSFVTIESLVRRKYAHSSSYLTKQAQ
jgi:peptidoglycan/xylan/chitin deacetylase (PgdA/CDA1 family)